LGVRRGANDPTPEKTTVTETEVKQKNRTETLLTTFGTKQKNEDWVLECKDPERKQQIVEEEAAEMGKTWKEVKRLANNRTRWRGFTDALCSS
jgi:hypothetical protein